MENRDRSTGWQYAKRSGHKNEELVKQLLVSNPDYANELLTRMGFTGETIKAVTIGGLHETSVTSVNGRRKTKSKTDLKIYLQSGKSINISIKKSLNGQVYFVSSRIFIDTFEKQFHKSIPDSVKRAIHLFWASADDAVSIIKEYANKRDERNYELQLHHASLNADTLRCYDETLYADLLAWFRDNAQELTELAFARGAAKDQGEWSDFVWYINLLGEHDTDAVFSIPSICKAAAAAASAETKYSSKNGGTTIQLPFGFVQWHQGKMQFHHKWNQVSKLAK